MLWVVPALLELKLYSAAYLYGTLGLLDEIPDPTATLHCFQAPGKKVAISAI